MRVTPARVLAPYERGTEVTRASKSQRERDLEAIELAKRKGLMLAQLGQLAEDPRLDPASVPIVEWFIGQVKDARGGARLDELAELIPQAGIRRRKWWQGRPAAIEAPAYDDEDDEDQADEHDDSDELDDDEAAPAVLATPASIAAQQHRAQPRRMTWADAIGASR